MQIEISMQQARILTGLLDQHVIIVDKYLVSDISKNLEKDERKVITTGCKIMKELSLQIKKKIEKVDDEKKNK